MTDSNYEAPITTDNFEEFDIKNDDKVEAENKINFIRSSDISSKRISTITSQKLKINSPRKNIIKTSSQKTPKACVVTNETKSEDVQAEDLPRDLDV